MTQHKPGLGAKAEVTAPNFFLQRKLGGPAGRMINPISIQRAQSALAGTIMSLEVEIDRLLRELHLAIETKSNTARGEIWQNAHDIRGIAGTASKRCLGEAADIVCRYLHGTEPNFRPDKAVLSTISTVAMLAMREGADDDPMVEKLLADGVRAVDAQRRREGRGPA
jgi:hypothetical protein